MREGSGRKVRSVRRRQCHQPAREETDGSLYRSPASAGVATRSRSINPPPPSPVKANPAALLLPERKPRSNAPRRRYGHA